MRVVFLHFGREHLGIEQLSSVLKQRGHEVFLVCDSGLFSAEDNVSYVPMLERLFRLERLLPEWVRALAPDVVCFTCYSSTFSWALKTARRLREFYFGPVVFGGIHITLVPKSLGQFDFVDFGIRGEAEESLPLLLDAIKGEADFGEVRGLIWRDGAELMVNPVGEPVDLDSLPHADKSIFEKEVNYEDDYLIAASRGCPNECTYCCERELKEIYGHGFYRRRSPENVIRELVEMKGKYDFKRVMFFDAVFIIGREWLKELLRDYKRYVGVQFRCFGHVGFFDEEIAELMRDAGCYNIEFGLQTSNERVRFEVLNRRESSDELQRAFEICDRVGIRYDIDYMFGLPTESEQDFMEAARGFKNRTMLNRVKVFYLTYYPGTPIIAAARGLGLLTDEEVREIELGEVPMNQLKIDQVKDPQQRGMHRRYERLFKVMPLLSAGMVDYILAHRWALGAIGRLPSALIVLLQILVAFKGRDYRFLFYFKYYIYRIVRTLSLKLGLSKPAAY